VCVLGYMGVGKSSLTIQYGALIDTYKMVLPDALFMYAEGQFIDAYSPTIENTFQKTVKHRDTPFSKQFFRDVFLPQVKHRDTEYLIEILDTAGQDEYQIFHMRCGALPPLFFCDIITSYAMGIHGYILMYATRHSHNEYM
jgi:Ras family protein